MIIYFYRNGGFPTSPLIGKYCGSKILPIISSIGNTLFVRFVSDGSRGRKGFFMQWYTTARGIELHKLKQKYTHNSSFNIIKRLWWNIEFWCWTYRIT